MAKDTEKLIRQLSLISYLMAERRPVTAPEIRRDVEGYANMNEDAFARRFYADRAELDSLGIQLTVEKPGEGAAEQENYSLPPENFFLSAIEFTASELAALQTALSLLDGEFAYAEPLRLALQQISWGRPSPLRAPEQRSVALGITASAGGHELSHRLAKIETAIFRRKTITFDYYTMARDAEGARRVDPYQLLFQGGQFYLVGRAHERDAMRVFRLSRIRGKVAYATKAEHDFQRPADFDPRIYANRIDWQLGEPVGTAEVWIGERIAWQVERHFGSYGTFLTAAAAAAAATAAAAANGNGHGGGGASDSGAAGGSASEGGGDPGEGVYTTSYASARQLVAWVLGLAEHARIKGPSELTEEYDLRLATLAERHRGERFEHAAALPGPPPTPAAVPTPSAREAASERGDAAIRPERFARLVTLASILIRAGREGTRLDAATLQTDLQVSEQELREDISVLNVVNFGAGSYVLYAEFHPDGSIEVDPDAYSDSFARPARLLPVEAKALVAAIDLIGEHLPDGSLAAVREKVVTALGEDPANEGLHVSSAAADDSDVARTVSRAIHKRRLLSFTYYKENEDELTARTVEPYTLVNGREGWYMKAYDPERDATRHFRLDRFKSAEMRAERYEPRPEIEAVGELDDWLRTGEVSASQVARVWISPERARWGREQRTITAELDDGALLVQLPYKGTDWLVREVLKEAGDLVVLEPAEARDAVREAVARLTAR